MAILFNITHDADNLDEYDATQTGAGDLSTSTPGLADTAAKMDVLIDDTGAIYGALLVSSPASGQIRVRVYIDPNTLTMADGDLFTFCRLQVTSLGHPIHLMLYYSDPDYQIRLVSDDDGYNWNTTSFYTITNEPHYIEAHVVQGAGDGTAELWIDGDQKQKLTGIDNQDAFDNIHHIRLGAIHGLDVGTSGTLFLDELKANDDGSEIGPVPLLGGFASIF